MPVAPTTNASTSPVKGDGTKEIRSTKHHAPTAFAKNLPRVAQIDAREAEATMIRQQKAKQDLFKRTHTKYPECRTTVFEPSAWAGYVQSLTGTTRHAQLLAVVENRRAPHGEQQGGRRLGYSL